jgi:hypothetical protein
MSETTEWYEHGYRLSDGTEFWVQDYGTDGSWIPFNREHNIGSIDFYLNTTEEDIYAELDKAGVEGVALRRKVTRHERDPEIVPRK